LCVVQGTEEARQGLYRVAVESHEAAAAVREKPMQMQSCLLGGNGMLLRDAGWGVCGDGSEGVASFGVALSEKGAVATHAD
jgi:hypothetical protein